METPTKCIRCRHTLFDDEGYHGFRRWKAKVCPRCGWRFELIKRNPKDTTVLVDFMDDLEILAKVLDEGKKNKQSSDCTIMNILRKHYASKSS